MYTPLLFKTNALFDSIFQVQSERKMLIHLHHHHSSTDVNGSEDELIVTMPRERVLEWLTVSEEDDLLDLDDWIGLLVPEIIAVPLVRFIRADHLV